MFDHPYYTNLMLQCDVFKIITLENVTSYFSFSYFSILLIIFIKTLTPFHLLPCSLFKMQDIAFELQQKYIIIRFRQKKNKLYVKDIYFARIRNRYYSLNSIYYNIRASLARKGSKSRKRFETLARIIR